MTVQPSISKVVIWLLTAGLAVALAYAVFRSYLSPELLIGFANGFIC